MRKTLSIRMTIAAMAMSGMAMASRAEDKGVVCPSKAQQEWAEAEIGVLLHLDMEVFHPEYNHRQYGTHPDPMTFNPTELNTDQWMETAHKLGAKYAVLTAKHGSGFTLWPTKTHDYNVSRCPWKDGKGDIVADFVASCHKYGIKPGIYANMSTNGYLWVDNPGLVQPGSPITQEEYASIMERQLTELWCNYGPLFEVWFDGGILSPAQGGTDALALLRRLQPNAIAFQGPYGYENLIRWVGNEVGTAPDPCWATADSTTNSDGVQVVTGLNGRPDAPFWCPGESDFTLRLQQSFGGGWMWHEGQDSMLYSVDELMRRYETSVGRNTNMLLGLVIDNRGLIPEGDVKRAEEFGRAIQQRYGSPSAKTKGRGERIELKLKEPLKIDRMVLQEDIAKGERILQWHVEATKTDGSTMTLCQGTNIGHKRIATFDPVEVTSLTLIADSCKARPVIRNMAVYALKTSLLAQKQYSGIYPSLAFYNDEAECGTGAVVPWAGRLWAITYGPHLAWGSSDKLYEITPDLKQVIREESVGGTHANRMIHRESGQLFIGPYAIDSTGKVRTISPTIMPGRLTGVARSITDPAHRLWIATMEEGFYDVGTDSLDVKTVFMDGNEMHRRNMSPSVQSPLLEGVHGKGFYSGQSVYVFSNNGEEDPIVYSNPRIKAGMLAEYDGREWKQIRRNQFTEVTGPGSIYGNAHPESDPIWTVGWDYRSLILAVREARTGWHFYRLPKASNSYDGAHGWNTEWPRIRNVSADDTPRYLMTMHGMLWEFPQTFTYGNSCGIRPLSSYLKVVGDFCYWNGRLVFGCDDSAKSEFLNKRKAKGGIAGPGQSQSNLWFVDTAAIGHLGPTDAAGSVWQNDEVEAGATSEAFLLAGWKRRTAWIRNDGTDEILLTFEVDKKGDGQWKRLYTRRVPAKSSRMLNLNGVKGEWIRVKTDRSCQSLTVTFIYASTNRPQASVSMFDGLSHIGEQEWQGGLLYCLGNNRKALGIVAHRMDGNKTTSTGYYELDGDMNLTKKDSPADSLMIEKQMAIPAEVITVDGGSYLITDDSGRRWRLPLGNQSYARLMEQRQTRICREVATERDLFNCGGTFYELPAENADGYAKIRPVCTHNLQIYDYASYRGLLVMTGSSATQFSPSSNLHLITSEDGNCQVWAGAIDDLWQLGKPRGEGGPWADTDVMAGQPSDPYLLTHYDHKTLTLSHSSAELVDFTIEIDPTGDGTWLQYRTVRVKPGKKVTLKLPDGHIGRWIRFTSSTSTKATAWLVYN